MPGTLSQFLNNSVVVNISVSLFNPHNTSHTPLILPHSMSVMHKVCFLTLAFHGFCYRSLRSNQIRVLSDSVFSEYSALERLWVIFFLCVLFMCVKVQLLPDRWDFMKGDNKQQENTNEQSITQDLDRLYSQSTAHSHCTFERDFVPRLRKTADT